MGVMENMQLNWRPDSSAPLWDAEDEGEAQGPLGRHPVLVKAPMAATTDRLLSLLRTHSYAKKKVVLASGKESDFFIDSKQTVLRAEGHALVGVAMFEALERLPVRPDAVAGVALAFLPAVGAQALTVSESGSGEFSSDWSSPIRKSRAPLRT